MEIDYASFCTAKPILETILAPGRWKKITAKNKCLFLVEESIKIPDEFEASHNVFKFSMSSTTEYYDLLELVMFILRKKSLKHLISELGDYIFQTYQKNLMISGTFIQSYIFI